MIFVKIDLESGKQKASIKIVSYNTTLAHGKAAAHIRCFHLVLFSDMLGRFIASINASTYKGTNFEASLLLIPGTVFIKNLTGPLN